MSTNQDLPPLQDHAFVAAFLNLVIPPGADGRMPGAGDLDLASTLAKALEDDAMLGPLALAGLQAVHDAALARDPGGLPALPAASGLEVVEAISGTHPMLMIGIARHLYPAYYQHPRVLEGIGEPPRPPFPEGYEVEPTDPGLLAKLRSRGHAVP